MFSFFTGSFSGDKLTLADRERIQCNWGRDKSNGGICMMRREKSTLLGNLGLERSTAFILCTMIPTFFHPPIPQTSFRLSSFSFFILVLLSYLNLKLDRYITRTAAACLFTTKLCQTLHPSLQGFEWLTMSQKWNSFLHIWRQGTLCDCFGHDPGGET